MKTIDSLMTVIDRYVKLRLPRPSASRIGYLDRMLKGWRLDRAILERHSVRVLLDGRMYAIADGEWFIAQAITPKHLEVLQGIEFDDNAKSDLFVTCTEYGVGVAYIAGLSGRLTSEYFPIGDETNNDYLLNGFVGEIRANSPVKRKRTRRALPASSVGLEEPMPKLSDINYTEKTPRPPTLAEAVKKPSRNPNRLTDIYKSLGFN